MSRKGEIKSEWSYGVGGLHISLVTPVEAEVELPYGRKETVTPGRYEYWIKTINNLIKFLICKIVHLELAHLYDFFYFPVGMKNVSKRLLKAAVIK